MVKVKLKGLPQVQWNIKNHMVAGGSIIELDKKEAKKYDDVILDILDKPKETKKPKKKKEYTKESLLEITNKKGFSGLRNIGKKFKVKFRSIEEGIREILEAQKNED